MLREIQNLPFLKVGARYLIYIYSTCIYFFKNIYYLLKIIFFFPVLGNDSKRRNSFVTQLNERFRYLRLGKNPFSEEKALETIIKERSYRFMDNSNYLYSSDMTTFAGMKAGGDLKGDGTTATETNSEVPGAAKKIFALNYFVII